MVRPVRANQRVFMWVKSRSNQSPIRRRVKLFYPSEEMFVFILLLLFIFVELSPLLFGGTDPDGVKLMKISLVHPRMINLLIDAQVYHYGEYKDHVLQPGEKIAYPLQNHTGDEQQDRVLYSGDFGSGAFISFVVGPIPPEGDCCVSEGSTVRVKEFDYVTGSEMNTSWAESILSYGLDSSTDTAYLTEKSPIAVYRKSKIDKWGYNGCWWQEKFPTGSGFVKTYLWTVLYEITLEFEEDLTFGNSYKISFYNGGSDEDTTLSGKFLDFDLDEEINFHSPAVHVNQIGFLPTHFGDAYVSYWLGSNTSNESTSHSVDYEDVSLTWKIARVDNKNVLASGGPASLRLLSTESENSFGTNFALSDIYDADLSSAIGLIDQDTDLVVIFDGIGSSYPFQVGMGVFGKAMVALLRVFYYQRNGVPLDTEWEGFTYSRPPALDPEITEMYYTTTTLAEVGNSDIGGHDHQQGWDKILEGATTDDCSHTQKLGAWQDAGDWDSRSPHLREALKLLVLLERFPEFFETLYLGFEGESVNQVPDILNQVLFLVDSYANRQVEDGGIGGDIEALSHPRYGEVCYNQTEVYYCHAPDPWTTFIFSGTTFYAARMLLEIDVVRAQDLAEKATSAFEWGVEHYDDPQSGPAEFQTKYSNHLQDVMCMATAQYMMWKDEYDADLYTRLQDCSRCDSSLVGGDGENQVDFAYLLAKFMPSRLTDDSNEMQEECKTRLIELIPYITSMIDSSGFRIGLATFLPEVQFPIPPLSPAMMYGLDASGPLGDSLDDLKRWSQMLGFNYGSNPLNLVFTTDGGIDGLLGSNVFRNPLRVDSAFTEDVFAPPGISVIGPLNMKQGSISSTMTFGMSPLSPIFPTNPIPIFPNEDHWPSFEFFVEAWPMITEYTPHATLIPSAFQLGFYLGAMAELGEVVQDEDAYEIVTTCYGYMYDDTVNVCSGRGYCKFDDVCVCRGNYFGRYCNETTCVGSWNNESGVCSGHGSCEVFDSCQCDENYYGVECDVTTCGGKFTNGTVCSNRGNCVDFDDCDCGDGFTGGECEVELLDDDSSLFHSVHIFILFLVFATL